MFIIWFNYDLAPKFINICSLYSFCSLEMMKTFLFTHFFNHTFFILNFNTKFQSYIWILNISIPKSQPLVWLLNCTKILTSSCNLKYWLLAKHNSDKINHFLSFLEFSKSDNRIFHKFDQRFSVSVARINLFIFAIIEIENGRIGVDTIEFTYWFWRNTVYTRE